MTDIFGKSQLNSDDVYTCVLFSKNKYTVLQYFRCFKIAILSYFVFISMKSFYFFAYIYLNILETVNGGIYS